MATRKQIAFDLDTSLLREYYPTESWNKAYDIIRNHMLKNDFTWQQGSVYVSNKGIPSYEITKILEKLIQENPWLNVCMRDCREADIGKEHSKNHLFDKSISIPTRAELRNKAKSIEIEEDIEF